MVKIARSTAIWFLELNRVKFKQMKRRRIVFSSQKSEPFGRKNQVNTVQAIQKLASKIPHPARRLHLKFRCLLPKMLENVATYHYHLPLASGVRGQSRKWATNVSFQLLKRSKCSSAKMICVGIALQNICRVFFRILPSCCMCVRCMRLNALQRALHTHTRCTCIFIRITHVVGVCTNRKKRHKKKIL